MLVHMLKVKIPSLKLKKLWLFEYYRALLADYNLPTIYNRNGRLNLPTMVDIIHCLSEDTLQTLRS